MVERLLGDSSTDRVKTTRHALHVECKKYVRHTEKVSRWVTAVAGEMRKLTGQYFARASAQVPHTVHGQIFELQPAEPALEVTSTQLGVECIFDDRAVAQLSDLSGQLARLKAEVDEAVAASDLLFKRHRESTKKFTREADASREEMRSVTAKFDVEKVQVREEVAVLQRKKMQLEALELVGNARSQTASGTTGDPKAAGEVHSAPAEVSIEAELDGFKPLDEKARRLVNAPPR